MLVDMITNPSQIVISCSGWRNPVLPIVTPGYFLRTLSASYTLIDQTEEFSFDASNFEAPSFE